MPSNWRTRVEQRLTQAWLERSFLSLALLPVALTYSVLATIRRWSFQTGLRKSAKLPAKVVVVGNVVAGGAGKTPTVIAIAEQLANDGLHVGVISRGYGRTGTGVQEVFAESKAAEVGDEPLLMHKRLHLPTFVGRDRVAAAHALLERYPQVNTIVCDDGIQHLPLFRDVEVYVFDNRGIGNGLPLPSGPLRSPWPPVYVAQAGQSAAKAVVLHTGSRPAFAGHYAQRLLAPRGLRSDGTTVSMAELQHTPQRFIAVAGIAQPAVFFQMLTTLGIVPVQSIAYPDHYDFADWTAPATPDCIVLCTEKDAAKIWQVEPTAIAIPLVQTMDHAFFEHIHMALAPQPSLPAGYH